MTPHPHPRDQRSALVDALASVGPQAPTLCAGWTARDLAAHVWVRENRSFRVAASLLSGRTERVDALMAAVKRQFSYPDLLTALRKGPTGASPFRLPGMEAAANTTEFFIHCEDVRRGAGATEPRALDEGLEELAWRRLPFLARIGLRGCPIAVWLERDSAMEPVRIGHGPDIVTLVGRPTEILLYLSGRRSAANIEIVGEPASVARVDRSKFAL